LDILIYLNKPIKLKMKSTNRFLTICILAVFVFCSCSRSVRKSSADFNHKPTEDKIAEIEKDTIGYGKAFPGAGPANFTPIDPILSKVSFFIENSGSMKGYVNGSTSYIDVLTDLANHPKFIQESIRRFYYFTSGISNPLRVLDLTHELRPERYNQRHSDLNNLFSVTLDSTHNNSVSILISDGIYDMCPNSTPLNTLRTLGHGLRSIFISRIGSQNFQTLLIKFKSGFNGLYSPGNCCSSYNINEERPFYIWIFGTTEIIEEYFPDDYIKNLTGYVNSARFFRYDSLLIPYKPVSHKRIGTYRSSKSDSLTYEKVKANTAVVFRFSIAVDFSHLPLNDDYIRDTSNYACSNGYSVESIDTPTAVAQLAFPSQTHLIVVRKKGNPLGQLTVSLRNKGYDWISSSNIDDDCNIRGKTDQTFGFEVLNEGIIDAYQYFNKKEEIESFNIYLKN